MKNSSYRHLRRLAGSKNHKKRLARIAEFSGYPTPAYYTSDGKGGEYLKRLYRPMCSSWLKRQASKSARRYKDELSSGGSYKKTYDYWWMLT